MASWIHSAVTTPVSLTTKRPIEFMSEELPPAPSSQPGGKLKFLLIALGPIPIGLLIFTSSRGGNVSGSGLMAMAFFTLICSIIGAIGLCGGYDKGNQTKSLIGGIALGIVIFVVDILITFFSVAP
jgi:hypothetical protein